MCIKLYMYIWLFLTKSSKNDLVCIATQFYYINATFVDLVKHLIPKVLHESILCIKSVFFCGWWYDYEKRRDWIGLKVRIFNSFMVWIFFVLVAYWHYMYGDFMLCIGIMCMHNQYIAYMYIIFKIQNLLISLIVQLIFFNNLFYIKIRLYY